MELKIVVAGIGGQGVIFITRLLAQTAVRLGHQVIASETHGMSQRGGSVISHVKIGRIQSPLIMKGTADILIALEENEAVRNLPYLHPGGMAFINNENNIYPETEEHIQRLNIKAHYLPANKIALELGSAKVANIVLVGYAISFLASQLPIDVTRDTLQSLLTHDAKLNNEALEAGYKLGQDETL